MAEEFCIRCGNERTLSSQLCYECEMRYRKDEWKLTSTEKVVLVTTEVKNWQILV